MPKIADFIISPKAPAKKKTVLVEEDERTFDIKEQERSIGIPAEEFNEVTTSQSIGSAVQSGLIKIPKGVINFGTLIYDALQEEGIDVERSLTQRFNDRFENTF